MKSDIKIPDVINEDDITFPQMYVKNDGIEDTIYLFVNKIQATIICSCSQTPNNEIGIHVEVVNTTCCDKTKWKRLPAGTKVTLTQEDK